MNGVLAILVAPAGAAASDVPTNLKATELTSDAVTITFTPSTRANRTGHRAVLDKNPPDGSAASKDLGRDATSVSFTGLTANTAYRVSVLVVVPPDNGIGNWVSFTTPTAPSVSVAAAPNPVVEGSPVTVTATLSKALGSDVTIPIALAAGTAEAGDHGSLTGITIAAGSTSNTGTITTADDADADDETFTVALGDLPASVTAGSPASVAVTIVDPRSVTLSAAPNPVNEGSPVTVTAALSQALGSDVEIPITLTAGTALPGDYGSLTGIAIAAGSTSNTGTITTADDGDIHDETFTVALGDLPASVAAGSPATVTVTITNPDVASVSLAAAPNPVAEGSPVTVTATLSEALENDLVIPLTLTAGTAEAGDHGSLAGIAIAAGSTSNTGTITTRKDADTDDETFTVALGTLPSFVTGRGATSATVTILDPRTVSLAAAPNPVVEGSPVTVTATLSKALGFDVTVPIDVKGAWSDTAEPGDYGSLTGIEIAAGATSNTGTVTTAIDADNDDETFTVGVGHWPRPWMTGIAFVVVTIVDPPPVSLSAAPNPVDEGSSVTVTATLSKALGSDVSIPIALTAGTADTSDYGSLTNIAIPAGATSATGAITTEDDADTEDQTFTVAFGDLPSSVVAGSATSVRVTITDPDVPSVSLDAAPNPVREGSPVTVTATIPKALGSDVVIPLTLTAGTAEASDYGSLASITIAAGSTSNTGTITTAIDADNHDETFTVALGDLPSPVTASSARSATVTIADPRSVSLGENISANEATEGEFLTVRVWLSGPALRSDVTIPLVLTPGTAEPGDYGSLAGITIAAGSKTGAGTIATAEDDDQDDETFTVSLGELPPQAIAGKTTSVVAKILEPPLASLRVSPDRMKEGSQTVVTAVLSRPHTKPVNIVFQFVKLEGPHVIWPDGHRRYDPAFGSGHSVLFLPGSTAETMTVTAGWANGPDDTIFRVNIVRVEAGVRLGDPVSATVTIVNNDPDNNGGGGGNGGGGAGGGPPPGSEDDDEDDDRDDGGGGGGRGGPPKAAITVNLECAEGLCRALTGVPVRFEDGSSGAVRFRRWEFGDGATSTSATPSHSWSSPGFYTVTLTVSDGETESTARRTFLVEAAEPAGSCEPSAATRCLQDSRFAVELERRTAAGETAAGHVVREGTNDSALFHFFEPDNWEVLVKVLDGCAANGHVWVYGASATTAGYTIRVTDTVTGKVREYRNEPGEAARAITDVNAFPGVCEG